MKSSGESDVRSVRVATGAILLIFIVAATLVFVAFRGPHTTTIAPAETVEGRLHSQQRRISELEARVDALALALRMERQDTDYDRQRRIEAIVARENARDR